MENTTDNAEEVKADEAQAETAEDTKTDNVESIEPKKEEDFKEKYYYLAAEMQNVQRRFEREKENLLKYGSEKVMSDLLDVVDNFERTLGFIEKDEDEKVKNIVVGLEMVKKLFIEALKKHGLTQIEAIGKEFDPNFHEALAQQPAEGKENNEVLLVHQNGYTLNERVIRASKVVIVKNS